MGLEQNAEHHYRGVVDKYHDPRSHYQMTTRDYVMRPAANNLTGVIQITLPPVAEALGRFYSIVARDADGDNAIVINDKGDSECWLTPIILTAKCQKVLLYSDGLCWHPLGAGGVGDFPGLVTTIGPATADPTTSAPTTDRGTTEAPTTGQN